MSTHPAPDPFLIQFFGRIPKDVASTFTDAQLDAVKRAFGARSWGAHRIDLRFSIPLPWRRYYVVFLCGTERRDPERRHLERILRPLNWLGVAFAVAAFVSLVSVPLLILAYLMKTAMGIDLAPDGGVHRLGQSLVDQIRLLFR
ncbi:MAG: 3-phosphoshikimate 1-carboxyvinyltransferase [Alphaproteobacteria bacterium]